MVHMLNIAAMRNVNDEALIQALASEIKAGRTRLSISQEELAGLAEINRTFIAKIETGRNQPSLCTFVRIAKGLGMEPVDLLESTMRREVKERKRMLLAEKRSLSKAG